MAHYKTIPTKVQAWSAMDLIEAAAKGLDFLPNIVAEEARANHWIFSSLRIVIPKGNNDQMLVSYKDMVVRESNGFFCSCNMGEFSKTYEQV